MPNVIVRSFAVSLDGFDAGPDQDQEHPLGVHGPELMEWFFQTRVWQRMHGYAEGETGVHNRVTEKAFENIGAWILGRNMFGPVRGPWPDDTWRGWCGEEPPYHVPVFVLTHLPRPPLRMKGNTEFFVVAPARRCSKASICVRSATTASSTCGASGRCTSGSGTRQIDRWCSSRGVVARTSVSCWSGAVANSRLGRCEHEPQRWR